MTLLPKESQQDTELSIQFIPNWRQYVIKSLSQAGVRSSLVSYCASTQNDAFVNALSAKTGITFKTLDQLPCEGAITEALDQISQETGLSFAKVSDPAEAFLGIQLVDGNLPGTEGGADGVSCHLNNSTNYWTDVFWNRSSTGNANPQDYIGTRLRHEIGHSFGFSHPANDGDNPRFNTADTVMSYLTDWWTDEAYLPQACNNAETNVFNLRCRSVTSGLSPVPINLNIDKSNFTLTPDDEVNPSLVKSYLSSGRTSAADQIVLGGGTYEARSGLGKDTYVITQGFIGNLAGFAVLSDFDPMRDKFVCADDVTGKSDLRFGSIGDIPSLFNADNLVAVFGVHDPYVSKPTLFQSTQSSLNGQQSQVADSLNSFMGGSSLFGLQSQSQSRVLRALSQSLWI